MRRRPRNKRRGFIKKPLYKKKKRFYGKGSRFSTLANLMKGGLKFFYIITSVKKVSINN